MLRRALAAERGSVLVIVALGVPMFILVSALALDFGNWYAHKRSAQNRVDAAAFAASVAYGYNFPACTSSQGAADNITNAAKQYAGNGSTPYNGSNGDGTTITVNPDGPNPCQPHSAGDYSSLSGTMWTDVHAKVEVPTLFGKFGVTPTITSNARVAVMRIKSATRFRPLMVANPAYLSGQCAWAIFENTASGTITVPLSYQGVDSKGNGKWHATRNIPVTGQNVTVNARMGDCGGSSSETILYNDVGYIGQYSQSGHSEPQFQGFFFSPLAGGCDALYISRRSPGCSYLVTFIIDPGPNNTITRATADINGSVALSGGGDTWQGTVSASQLQAGSGASNNNPPGTIPVTVTGRYRHRDPGPPPRTRFRSFSLGTSSDPLQRFMAGDDRQEGPIVDFSLSQIEVNKNNTIQNEEIDLTVEPLSGPVTLLRARGGTASNPTLNGAVDCADAQAFSQEIRYGCTSFFQVHPQSVCSGSATAPPDCMQGVGTGSVTSAYNALWAPTGNCSRTPNNWPSYPNIPRGDPRLITVPVTRVGGAFTPGSRHPVVSFAAFYVTGWEGMPSGCGDQNAAATAPATAALGNEVWGHFVRFVEPSSTGAPQNSGTSSDACPVTTSDIAACIATLVQ